MNDLMNLNPPVALAAIQADTQYIGFDKGSEPLTGSLLRTLAASKPGGVFLEIGTGTGIGTSWLLDGMNETSVLVSVERDESVSEVARRRLGYDSRLHLVTANAESFLKNLGDEKFDLVFSDVFSAKFNFDLLYLTLDRLKPGALYVIDDLLPQPTWPDNHQPNVDRLIAELEQRSDLRIKKLKWASGLIMATKIATT